MHSACWETTRPHTRAIQPVPVRGRSWQNNPLTFLSHTHFCHSSLWSPKPALTLPFEAAQAKSLHSQPDTFILSFKVLGDFPQIDFCVPQIEHLLYQENYSTQVQRGEARSYTEVTRPAQIQHKNSCIIKQPCQKSWVNRSPSTTWGSSITEYPSLYNCYYLYILLI